MSTKKRERLDVINDMLTSIMNSSQGKMKPTRLLYSSNLSSAMFKDYISELLKNELVEEHNDKKNKKHYVVTDKGFEFIRKYSSFSEFVNNLGL